MDWLTDDPWPAIGVGLLAEALLAVVWFNTRQKAVFAWMAGVLALVGVLLLAEWLIQSDAEQVEQTLDELCVALETNDLPRVLEFIAEDAPLLRAAAESRLPGLEITDAEVKSLKVTIIPTTSPISARAEFVGRLALRSQDPSEILPYENFIRRFSLKLRRTSDRWQLTEYAIQNDPDPRP